MSEGDQEVTSTRRTKEAGHHMGKEQHVQRNGAVEHIVFVGNDRQLKSTRGPVTKIAQSS